jgi:hypothetical protein
MKMGTIVSLWRYDVAAADAIRPDNRRRTTILRYALWAAVLLVLMTCCSILNETAGIQYGLFVPAGA